MCFNRMKLTRNAIIEILELPFDFITVGHEHVSFPRHRAFVPLSIGKQINAESRVGQSFRPAVSWMYLDLIAIKFNERLFHDDLHLALIQPDPSIYSTCMITPFVLIVEVEFLHPAKATHASILDPIVVTFALRYLSVQLKVLQTHSMLGPLFMIMW